MSRLSFEKSPIVRHQAEIALSSNATADLEPIEESGIYAWVVTPERLVGDHPLPPAAVERARTFLNGVSSTGYRFPFRFTRIQAGATQGVLITRVPGVDTWRAVLLRIFILLFFPILVCVLMARRIAAPIEQIQTAARRFTSGELSTRIGFVGGPREIRALAKNFDQLAAKLEATFESQNRMMADVSHEVRSPLARMRLAAQMIEERKGNPADYAQRIQKDVDRLDAIVETLLAMLTPDGAPPQPVDLAPIVAEVLDAVLFENQAKGLTAIREIESCFVPCSAPKLFSIVENILRNAARYAPAGSAIEVRLTASNRTLTISDQGPGVPPEHLTQIFQPFFRCSESRDRQTGGVGLGLALVRKFVEEAGGEVIATVNSFGGLTVTVVFGSSDRRT